VDVMLFKMEVDKEKGGCVYCKSHKFTLPTTHQTFSHMEIALGMVISFKAGNCDVLIKRVLN
jgi:hypothetical protein